MKTIIYHGGEHAVLALHGLLGNPMELQYVGKRLNQTGYTVVIPLIPGYGMARGQGKRFEVAPYAEWLQFASDCLDDMKTRYRTVSVTGLCIGAVMALALASMRSSDITALSLLSTTLAYDGWSIPRARVLLPLVYYTPFRRSFSYRERYPYGLKNERLRRWVAEQMAQSDASDAGATILPAEAIFQAQRLIKSVRRRLPQVTSPALIMHAQDDDVASPESAYLVTRRISSPIHKTIILHDSYHMITMDNEKENVAQESIAFFQLITGPATPDRQACASMAAEMTSSGHAHYRS